MHSGFTMDSSKTGLRDIDLLHNFLDLLAGHG